MKKAIISLRAVLRIIRRKTVEIQKNCLAAAFLMPYHGMEIRRNKLSPWERMIMIRFSELFERYIMFFTLILMMLSIVFGTAELVWILVQEIIRPPVMMLDIEKLLDFFGFFMMILIGLELMYSIKTYLKKEMIQVEIVLIVAIIAIARKIIILDTRSLDGVTLLGLGFLIVALSAGYFLIRKSSLINARDAGTADDE
jgi:uncharacterized membrane protein (DUF373 family)